MPCMRCPTRQWNDVTLLGAMVLCRVLFEQVVLLQSSGSPPAVLNRG